MKYTRRLNRKREEEEHNRVDPAELVCVVTVYDDVTFVKKADLEKNNGHLLIMYYKDGCRVVEKVFKQGTKTVFFYRVVLLHPANIKEVRHG